MQEILLSHKQNLCQLFRQFLFQASVTLTPCDQYFEAGGVVESVVDGLVPVVLPGVVLLGGVVELDELEEPDAELSVDVEGDGIGVAGGVVVLDGLVVGDGLLVDGVVMRSSLARSQPTTVAANAPATNNAARGRI